MKYNDNGAGSAGNALAGYPKALSMWDVPADWSNGIDAAAYS